MDTKKAKRAFVATVVTCFSTVVACATVSEEAEAESQPLAATSADAGSRTERHGRHHGRGRHGFRDPSAFFARVDINKNGTLEATELTNVPEHRREKLMRADANHDGNLTLDELRAAMAARAQERFARHDKNGDGALTQDEVGEGRFRFLSQADANGDARITAEEIRKAHEEGKLRGIRGHHRGHSCSGG